ncbi:RidA family protein [Haloglomus litoreum]|uniref:RidA family protein n=1 Tax=Haloglomus litoreum TaxID=3034026 RepID=UPI0023E784A5|nr:RidA family protein [Haloglomus sp. DT116]
MTRVIDSPDLPDVSDRNYSQARIDDGTLYVAGQVGWDADNEIVGDDIESQTRRTFRNVELILEEVDRDLGDVTKVTSYFTHIEEDFPTYKEVWSELFEAPYPCHTAIGVAKLAAPETRVEVEFQAPV